MKYTASIVLALGILFTLSCKPSHRDIESEKAVANLTAAELFATFEADEDQANKLYLDKTLTVTGKVIEVKTDKQGSVTAVLDSGGTEGINVTMKEGKVVRGTDVTLKCKCNGLNLFGVELVSCSKLK